MGNDKDRVGKQYEGAAIEAWAPGGKWQNAEVRKVGTGSTGGILTSGFSFPGNVVRAQPRMDTCSPCAASQGSLGPA